jgi:hypothetical protein
MREATMTDPVSEPTTDALARPGDGELLACVRAALGGEAGAFLLRHLERRYLGHALAPSASDAELRHLEGQRSVVLYLHHLVATARRNPSGDFA